jgi:hypothetical protein
MMARPLKMARIARHSNRKLHHLDLDTIAQFAHLERRKDARKEAEAPPPAQDEPAVLVLKGNVIDGERRAWLGR